MTKEQLLNEETNKLVGYIMPILEAEKVSDTTKKNIKNLIWKNKDSILAKLNKGKQNDKSNTK